MKRRTAGWIRALTLSVAAAGVVLACKPIDDTDSADTVDPFADPDGGTSGRLYDVPMRLTWAWAAQEGDGVCVDLKVGTNGAAVRSWRLFVDTDTAVVDLYYVEGADIRWIDGRLSIAPSQEPELDGTQEVLAKFCSRPGVRLIAMEAEVTYVDEPDTDIPDQPNPYDVLLDPGIEYGLQYSDDGTENGGKCLRFDVLNLSSVPVIDWALEVTMAGPVGRTASSGLWFYEGDGPDKLVVLPDTDSRIIEPYDAESGRICLLPFAEPIAIRSGDAPEP